MPITETGVRYTLEEPTGALATGTIVPESCDTTRYRLCEPLYIEAPTRPIPPCPDTRMR